MKKWAVLFLLLCLEGLVYANPVVYPTWSDGAYLMVVVSAAVIEVSIVTLILSCFDLSVKRLWFGLLVGNLLVYFIIFVPLYREMESLFLTEMVVVALDGIVIKVISLCSAFQETTFKMLKLRHALIIAAIGNVSSYYVGTLIGA